MSLAPVVYGYGSGCGPGPDAGRRCLPQIQSPLRSHAGSWRPLRPVLRVKIKTGHEQTFTRVGTKLMTHLGRLESTCSMGLSTDMVAAEERESP